MNHKEEAALKKCSPRIKKDLDPTYSFLHSHVVEQALTHDDMETIMVSQHLKLIKVFNMLILAKSYRFESPHGPESL